MEERCALCRYCCELYTPPTAGSKAKYEYCCTLFLKERRVMVLGDDIYGPCARCECFDSTKDPTCNTCAYNEHCSENWDGALLNRSRLNLKGRDCWRNDKFKMP